MQRAERLRNFPKITLVVKKDMAIGSSPQFLTAC